MAITTTVYGISYAGNNSTVTAYQIPFEFLATTDIVVTTTASGGSPVTLANGVDFTVTHLINRTGSLVTTAAVPISSTVAIRRATPILQPTVYPESGPFPSESHETALDRLTMCAQEIAGGNGGGLAVTPDSLRDVVRWEDATARASTVPYRRGQIGVQMADRALYMANSTATGDWTAVAGSAAVTLVTTFAGFTAALAIAGEAAIDLGADITVTADVTIPRHKTVTFGPYKLIQGGTWLIKWHGEVDAGRRQIFSGFLRGQIRGQFKNDGVFPEWWGMTVRTGTDPNAPTNETSLDDEQAIMCAAHSNFINGSAGIVTGSRVLLAEGVYFLRRPVDLTNTECQLSGAGPYRTKLKTTTAWTPMRRTMNGYGWFPTAEVTDRMQADYLGAYEWGSADLDGNHAAVIWIGGDYRGISGGVPTAGTTQNTFGYAVTDLWLDCTYASQTNWGIYVSGISSKGGVEEAARIENIQIEFCSGFKVGFCRQKSPLFTTTNVVRAANEATITTATSHSLIVGDLVTFTLGGPFTCTTTAASTTVTATVGTFYDHHIGMEIYNSDLPNGVATIVSRTSGTQVVVSAAANVGVVGVATTVSSAAYISAITANTIKYAHNGNYASAALAGTIGTAFGSTSTVNGLTMHNFHMTGACKAGSVGIHLPEWTYQAKITKGSIVMAVRKSITGYHSLSAFPTGSHPAYQVAADMAAVADGRYSPSVSHTYPTFGIVARGLCSIEEVHFEGMVIGVYVKGVYQGKSSGVSIKALDGLGLSDRARGALFTGDGMSGMEWTSDPTVTGAVYSTRSVTTNASPTITGGFTQDHVGYFVEGAGILDRTVINSVVTGVSATLSANATASATIAAYAYKPTALSGGGVSYFGTFPNKITCAAGPFLAKHVGWYINKANVPVGTYITAVVSATEVTISGAGASDAATSATSIFPKHSNIMDTSYGGMRSYSCMVLIDGDQAAAGNQKDTVTCQNVGASALCLFLLRDLSYGYHVRAFGSRQAGGISTLVDTDSNVGFYARGSIWKRSRDARGTLPVLSTPGTAGVNPYAPIAGHTNDGSYILQSQSLGVNDDSDIIPATAALQNALLAPIFRW